MIGIDSGVFILKTLLVEGLIIKAVKVDEDNIYTEMALIE